MKTVKNKKWMLALAMVVGVAPILVSVEYNNRAYGTDACATEECKKAKQEAEEAEEKSASSLSAAQEYEMQIKKVALEIEAQEKRIDATEEKIDGLKDEIDKTKKNLEKKQEALAEMLVNMHFDSDKEPIRILAGSESISDLAEKASREDTARRQIGTAAEAVRDAKNKLEEDKQEVEDLLEDQQETRKQLVSKKKEQNEIKAKYEADAEGFAEEAKLAREKQLEEEAAYRDAHPEEFSIKSSGYYSTSNSYEYAANCPEDNLAYNDRWGYSVCQCTSYAAWAASRYANVDVSGWGHAYSWADNARPFFRVDNNPEAMSIGQTTTGLYGHVFWVESVDADGINISEYNYNFSGDFYSRKIYFPEAYNYNYIHVKG